MTCIRLWKVFSLAMATITYPSDVPIGPNIGRCVAFTSNCDNCNSFKVRLSIDSSIDTSMCWPLWLPARWYNAAEMAPKA